MPRKLAQVAVENFLNPRNSLQNTSYKKSPKTILTKEENQTKLQHRKGAKLHKPVKPHETLLMSFKCLGGKTAPPTSDSALLGIILRKGGT